MCEMFVQNIIIAEQTEVSGFQWIADKGRSDVVELQRNRAYDYWSRVRQLECSETTLQPYYGLQAQKVPTYQ